MDERVALDLDAGARGSTGEITEDLRPVGSALPTVVAVVVTHNPGPWFEEALASLAGQEYPNLSILVFDADSEVDPTPRIAAVAPRAYVRRLGANAGFGAAANQALTMVEGAPFFLVCHDDVALAPNAVRLLVEEAYRSNAGVVGPKLVRWDEPLALLAVGMGADRFGSPFPLCERNELDQEQHDGVRDVFFVPGVCFLVRADLLRALGGFDEAMTFHGEDTDLCWRAHLAGARVLVAPSARARHVEALGERRPDDRRRLQLRHRLRMVLTNYGWFYLVGEVLQQVVLSLVELVVALVTGRVRHAADITGAWTWNLKRTGSLLAKRRRVRATRQVTDLELRRLQVRGSARLTGFLRGQVGSGDADSTLGDSLRQWLVRRSAGAQPHNVVAAVFIAVVLLFGSRHLLTRPFPAVGEFVPFPGRARDVLRLGVSGWRDSGVGAAAPAPTGLALTGLAGVVALGATGLLRLVLIVGTIPLGLVGIWRLGSFSPHSRAKGAMLLAYAVNPLLWNALVAGRWRALALYGLLPWVVRILARCGRFEPVAAPTAAAPTTGVGHGGRPPGSRLATAQPVAALGAISAVLVALYPPSALLVVLTAVALVAGSLLAGQPGDHVRLLSSAVAGTVIGLVLHAPWLVSAWAADDPDVHSFARAGGADEVALPDLLRFHTGRFGGSWVGWGLLLAGLVALVIGRSWRLGWAVRGWSLYAVPLLVVVVVQAGWVDVRLPAPEVLLAPAALGVAIAAGAGVAAFDIDLRAYRFGWRQLASVLGALGLVVALVPLVFASFNGRWHMARGGYDRVLGFLDDEQREQGPFRVLWLGAADALPLAGWPVGDGVTSYATSVGYPSIASLWTGPETDATQLIPNALDAARQGGDNRLGQRLGVFGIRYVVVVDRSAPFPFEARDLPAQPWLDATLSSQLDLAEVDLNAALRVYRNSAWLPTVATVPDGVQDPAKLPLPESAGAPAPALPATGPHRFGGELPDGVDVHLAEAFDPGWRLDVAGTEVEGEEGFGFANRFRVERGGVATLSFVSSPALVAAVVAQVAAWAALCVFALGGRGLRRPVRRRGRTAAGTAAPGAPSPDDAGPDRHRTRPDRTDEHGTHEHGTHEHGTEEHGTEEHRADTYVLVDETAAGAFADAVDSHEPAAGDEQLELDLDTNWDLDAVLEVDERDAAAFGIDEPIDHEHERPRHDDRTEDGEDGAGDETTGDDRAGDETTGDDRAGDETTGDDRAGHDRRGPRP